MINRIYCFLFLEVIIFNISIVMELTNNYFQIKLDVRRYFKMVFHFITKSPAISEADPTQKLTSINITLNLGKKKEKRNGFAIYLKERGPV
jgi:hypothetical protein